MDLINDQYYRTDFHLYLLMIKMIWKIESDYCILVKGRCGGGVDPIKGFPVFLTDRMRVSISHQVLQNGQ
jgi:hypothetical protein